jgi:hypothetical protein
VRTPSKAQALAAGLAVCAIVVLAVALTVFARVDVPYVPIVAGESNGALEWIERRDLNSDKHQACAQEVLTDMGILFRLHEGRVYIKRGTASSRELMWNVTTKAIERSPSR